MKRQIAQTYQNIAITGASSGLGRALALAYAHPGATLHLAGRDAARLGEAATTARALGATVIETILDVTDQAGSKTWINASAPLDLVIANAGISIGPGDKNLETPENIRALIATNIDGVFNTVLPAIEVMRAQPPNENAQKGRIAIIGSIAGLMALPISPTYSATKAMLDTWVTATTRSAARENIGLTLIRPGFIRTPMTAINPYTMPGIMDADAAARLIRAGLAAGRTHITFPWWLALLARLSRLAPPAMFDNIKRKPPG